MKTEEIDIGIAIDMLRGSMRKYQITPKKITLSYNDFCRLKMIVENEVVYAAGGDTTINFHGIVFDVED
jgi:hypothetical protein